MSKYRYFNSWLAYFAYHRAWIATDGIENTLSIYIMFYFRLIPLNRDLE